MVNRHPALLAALVAALACSVPSALADGDPASDYLISQSTYLSPFDGHVSPSEARILVQLLADAKAKGFPVKVAVILKAYDLGAVPILFKQPKRYAKFLGEEDFYYFKAELLVVMPNGYGLYKAKALPAADNAVIARLPRPPAPATGDGLVQAADRAVIALAAQHGIKLQAGSGKAAGSGTGHDRIVIAAAVLIVGLLGLAIRFGRQRRRRLR